MKNLILIFCLLTVTSYSFSAEKESEKESSKHLDDVEMSILHDSADSRSK